MVAAQTQNVVFLPLDKLVDSVKHLPLDVVEIGCGLSQSDLAQSLFTQVIDNIPKDLPLIVDADGLNIISKNPDIFISKGLSSVVFTPHPLEAARLLDCSLEEVLADVKLSAKNICKKYNCITVLKTHRAVVVSPDERIYENTTGNNAMAKAGSGDVLCGIISGLVAQGMDLFEACSLAVYLHGLSGDLAAEKLTVYSVMAEDLISFIPKAVKLYLNN